jgi:ZIP family zinc transporter
MDINNVIIGFVLATLAGLSTGIGSLMGIFSKLDNTRFLSLSLGFSAGVMIYVSFVELLQLSFNSLNEIFGFRFGALVSVTAFIMAILIMLFIDQLFDNRSIGDFVSSSTKNKKQGHLLRTGIFSALALAIHNFPEGFATFTAALYDPAIGVTLAIAIAIHNIPEGIAVAVPIYFATKSKKKAFWISLLSGIAEPIGALMGYLIFRSFINEAVFGITFAFCAGIMVYVALNEQLPVSREYGKPSDPIIGVSVGMIVMAVSLILMNTA